MEGPTGKKGTVTPFASMFSVDMAERAAKRVEDAIAEKRKELETLRQFLADNSNLVNLVSKLPEELEHQVMVPFGKAAFFPGQLVHTNEFMVFLGEGYYAERTAKQTVEILKRRGKALESQVESLKANVKDLMAEASFFGATASDAAEGLVEIREDYEEDNSGGRHSQSDKTKVTVEDDEYACIMSRLDELEKEEIAAEGELTEESEQASTDGGNGETDEDEEIDDTGSDGDSHIGAQSDSNVGQFPSQNYSKKPEVQINSESSFAEELSKKYCNQLNVTDQKNCTGLTAQPLHRDAISNDKNLMQNEMRPPLPNDEVFVLPKVKEKFEEVLPSRKEAFTSSIVNRSCNIQSNSQVQAATALQKPVQASEPGFDSLKAFTGSIVEHTHNLPKNLPEHAAASPQTSDPPPSKPVSRFKMQRR